MIDISLRRVDMTTRNGNYELNVLGEAFLRSAYVVYDMQNNQIGLAQAVQNATASHIVEVAAGAKSIPTVSGVSLPTSTPTPSHSPTPKPSPPPTKPSKTNVVPIAIGVAVPVVVILAGLVGFFMWRRRRNNSNRERSDIPPPVFVDQSYDAATGVSDQKNPPLATETQRNYDPYHTNLNSGQTQPQMSQNNFISELPAGNQAFATPVGSPDMSKSHADGAYPQSNRGSLPVYSAHNAPEDRPMSPALSEMGSDAAPGSPMSNFTAQSEHNNVNLH
jgi:hypothetical protein